MTQDKQIKADKLTVARTPDGGATLYISTDKSTCEVSLTAEAWGKLEEYVKWSLTEHKDDDCPCCGSVEGHERWFRESFGLAAVKYGDGVTNGGQ